MAITQSISPFPDAPNSSDTPEDFNSKANAFVAHQSGVYVPEVNNWATQANSTKNQINTSGADAAQSAADAESFAAQSASSANFVGDWNSGTAYKIGESVSVDGAYYRALTNNSNKNPTISVSDWLLSLPFTMAVGNINNPLLDIPLNNSLDLKQGVGSVTFTRATTATYIDRYGVLKTAQINEPRFEKGGLLIEGASTNLFLNSDVGATQTIAVVSGKTYTVSFLEGNGIVTLSGSGSGIVDKDNNITFVASSNSVICTVTGQADKVQFEKLPFASSYIPTVASAVTRSADNCSIDFYNNIPSANTEEMSIAVDSDRLGINTVSQTMIRTSGELHRILSYASIGRVEFRYGSITSWYLSSNNVMDSIRNVGAVGNNIVLYKQGILKDLKVNLKDITGNITKIGIGSFNNSEYLFGHISNVRIYNRALSAEEARLT